MVDGSSGASTIKSYLLCTRNDDMSFSLALLVLCCVCFVISSLGYTNEEEILKDLIMFSNEKMGSA